MRFLRTTGDERQVHHEETGRGDLRERSGLRAYIPPPLPESLRYTLAGSRRSDPDDPALFGHKNLETTALYLGVSDVDKMRDKINEAFGD